MTTSQNGWPVLEASSHKLVTWVVPLKHNKVLTIKLRNGSAGFLLCHYIVWYDRYIEPVWQRRRDDWGWAPRNIRGSSEVSNHASGTAVDLNATKHPLGKIGTIIKRKVRLITGRIRYYSGCLRSGIFYHGRKDEMHIEINRPLARCERKARRLLSSPIGKLIIEYNPHQKDVILS